MKQTQYSKDSITDSLSQSEVSNFLSSLLNDNDSLFVKKLSLNDRDWAQSSKKHQNGVYIPAADRDSGFFPPLETKERGNSHDAKIHEVYFKIEWPAIGETKEARLVHYTSKREETHMTRLPKAAFRGVSPASLLLLGKKAKHYKALVIDSQSDEYDAIHDILSLSPDFSASTFITSSVQQEREKKTISFMEEIIMAFFNGTFPAVASRYRAMPTTLELAIQARNRYLIENNLQSLNPYSISAPGDALRTISRGLEYEVLKDYQIKICSIELIQILLGDDPKQSNIKKVLRAIILDFPKIDTLLLSASQQRKSRAGYSFEHHIEAMLTDGEIPFEKQVVLEARKRPDFILPNKKIYVSADRHHDEALVLSAKTTLRERWKQVKDEMRNCDLYLATVDERIAGNAIEDMAAQGISLVVPESLKASKITEYKSQPSVISFKDFFENDIAKRTKLWLAKGIGRQGAV